MRRLFPPMAALSLAIVLSVLAAGCGGASKQNKPGLVTSWGKDGVVELPGFEVKQTLEDRSGRILALGNYQGRVAQIVRLLPDGSLDSSFGKSGIVRWPFHPHVGRFPRGGDYLGWDLAALLPDGRTILAGTNIVGLINEKSTLIVSEIDESGKVVKSFGHDGYYTADKRLYDCPAASVGKNCERIFFSLARTRTTCTRGPAALAIQGEKIVIAADRFCKYEEPHQIVVLRLNPKGTLDRSFGKKGEVDVSVTNPRVGNARLLAFPDGRLVVADMTPKGGMVRLTGLLRNGMLDLQFGKKGVALTRVATDSFGLGEISAFMSDGKENLSLTGSNDNGPFLVRFYRSGKPDNFWTGSPWVPPIMGESNYENFGGAFGLHPTLVVYSGVTFTQLKNGELVAAGGLLAKVTPDGVFDPSYPPQQVYGAGKLRLRGLLASSDGTVLVTLLKYHVVPGTYTTYLARYR